MNLLQIVSRDERPAARVLVAEQQAEREEVS
jgi:hypothetical protein